MPDKIMPVDVSTILHAAKHSLGKHKLSKKEIPTYIIFGFLNSMFYYTKKIRPTHTVLALDSKKSIRREFYPGYKNRDNEELDEEGKLQKELEIQQFMTVQNYVIPKLNFSNVFKASKFEADDVIAQVCLQYKKDEIVIVANDHDLFQLLKSNICMFDVRTRKYFTKKDFISKYGIKPKQWRKVKSIGGCKSDTVLGVPIPKANPNSKQTHVGEAGAINYILGKTKPHTKAYQGINSEEGKAVIKRNKRLVVLPHEGTPEFNITHDKISYSGFKEVCKEFGFKSLLSAKEDWRKLFKMR